MEPWEDGERVIRTGRSLQTVTMAFFSFALAVVLGGILAGLGSPRGLPAVTYALYGGIAVFLVFCCFNALRQALHYLRSTLTLGDEGVTYRDWRGRARSVLWSDLREIVVQDNQQREGSRGISGVASTLFLVTNSGEEQQSLIEVCTVESRPRQVELAKLIAEHGGLTYVGEIGGYSVAWRRQDAASSSSQS